MLKYKYSYINKIVSKLRNYFIDIFSDPVVINGCLFFSWGRVVHRNWGDDINYYLIKSITGKPISYLYTSSFSMRGRKENFLIIGSTITMLTNSQTIIWGAGVIDPKLDLPAIPKKVLAVRGPLSRKYLNDRGIDCPAVYGDPAMLLKYYYQPHIKKKYKLGIIPHYEDISHPLITKLNKNSNVLIINMEGYKNWLEIIDMICSCEYIASSSLHGLIMAETYNVPNLWIELYGSLLGGYFKFHDFFQSINCDREKPYIINSEDSLESILETKNQYKKGYIDLTPLINSAPFKINIVAKNGYK